MSSTKFLNGISIPGVGTVPNMSTTNGTYINASNNWATTNSTDNVMIVKNNPASLEVKGTLVINGQDLEERLKTIEKVLMIPERDVKMEAKYPSLKKKFDEYINALGKYRTFEAIKGEDE
jgi:hypothetical protein